MAAVRKEIVKVKRKKNTWFLFFFFLFFIDLISLAFSHFSYAKRTASLQSSVTPDIHRLWKAYPFERNPTSWVPSHPSQLHGYSPGESFPIPIPYLWNPPSPLESLSLTIFYLSTYLSLMSSLFGIHLSTYNIFMDSELYGSFQVTRRHCRCELRTLSETASGSIHDCELTAIENGKLHD